MEWTPCEFLLCVKNVNFRGIAGLVIWSLAESLLMLKVPRSMPGLVTPVRTGFGFDSYKFCIARIQSIGLIENPTILTVHLKIITQMRNDRVPVSQSVGSVYLNVATGAN